MAPDSGNAVDAKWVGPSGQQLFDGTALNHGDVVKDVGYDEAKDSAYWEIVQNAKSDEVVGSAAANRDDWSFGVEEGGAGTGRPEADEPVEPLRPPAPPASPAPPAPSDEKGPE